MLGNAWTALKTAAISSFGSSKCLNGTGSSFRKSSASPRLSFEFTPMNTTSPLRFSAWSRKKGNSSRQGPHQLAHLFTTTGLPRSLLERAARSVAAAGDEVALEGGASSELQPARATQSRSSSGGQPAHAAKDGRALE